MAGPHPPNPTVGADRTHQRTAPYPEGDTARSARTLRYPQSSIPRNRCRHRRHTRDDAQAADHRRLLAIALIAAVTAAIVYGVRTNGANTGAAFSEGSAKTAIQGYLDALEHRDIETIARNALCGLYDGVKDRRSDQALAKLSSDAFRKQFSEVQVTSIDKIVYLSQYQAQVLFTMQVTPATGGPLQGQMQGIAQLLFQRGQILVCSYVLRTAGQL